MTLRKLVSGGQTGVDRAALDAALDAGLPCGGWCPRGRRAEDGPIDTRYPLRETPDPGYTQRTRWNVRDSDGTLILTYGRPYGGTALTLRHARKLHRPVLVIDLCRAPEVGPIAAWLEREGIGVLNVAGPRESARPGIAREARALLAAVLRVPGGPRATPPDERDPL